MSSFKGSRNSVDAGSDDTDAIGEVVERIRPRLLRIASRIAGENRAEDIVQDAAIVAIDRLSELRDTERVESWLSGIVRNLSLNAVRSNRIVHVDFESVPDSSEASDPLQRALISESEGLLLEAVDRLSDRYRVVVQAFYLDEKIVRETARELDISEQATKTRLSRARATLRREMCEPITEDDSMSREDKVEELACSFCKITAADAEKLITGPGVNICSSCVQKCVDVMMPDGFKLSLAKT